MLSVVSVWHLDPTCTLTIGNAQTKLICAYQSAGGPTFVDQGRDGAYILGPATGEEALRVSCSRN
jgi:hypothetical protein